MMGLMREIVLLHFQVIALLEFLLSVYRESMYTLRGLHNTAEKNLGRGLKTGHRRFYFWVAK